MQAIQLSCLRDNHPVFVNISFDLQAQALLLVEGENGSGKSSLLRILASLATPTSGQLLWKGQAVTEQRLTYANSLHYVGHTNGLKLGLTVNENLQLMSSLATMTTSVSSMNTILEALQLGRYQTTLAAHLSAGQKRRLSLAKLFLIPREFWILDEPLTALDATTQQYFLQQLETHLLSGGMAVVSSHHVLAFNKIKAQTLRLGSC